MFVQVTVKAVFLIPDDTPADRVNETADDIFRAWLGDKEAAESVAVLPMCTDFKWEYKRKEDDVVG